MAGGIGMVVIDKELVRRRFERQLDTYSSNALVQGGMADRLALLVAERLPGRKAGKVFEIGVGSGMLTGALLSNVRVDSFYANDIAPGSREMVEHVASRYGVDLTGFLGGDAEKIEMLPGGLDLAISGATVQWFEDLPGFIGRIAGSIRPGGLLAFSTFGPENMKEIAELTSVGLSYHTLKEIEEMSGDAYDVLCAEEQRSILDFPDPRAVLRHISRTGVNGIERRTWTGSRLRSFSTAYHERFASPGGVQLTYHELYLVMRRRQS